jgi:hypothetical protein
MQEGPVEIQIQTRLNLIGRCTIATHPALSPITIFTSHCTFITAREKSERDSFFKFLKLRKFEIA